LEKDLDDKQKTIQNLSEKIFQLQ